MTATYSTTPDGSLHLVGTPEAGHTLCGLEAAGAILGDETVIGAKGCAVCHRSLRAQQRRVDKINRAHEGRS